MWPTMEVRWFHDETIRSEIADWFRNLAGEPDRPVARVDHYLRLEDTDALGIKLREGKIELKQRHRQCGLTHLSGRAAGWMEHWRKWSFALADAEGQLKDAVGRSMAWIAVEKERQLRRYEITAAGQIVAVPATHYPERGCNVELSEIRAQGRRAWSLAFEASGDKPTLRQNLLRVAQHVFAQGPASDLEPENSFGYPKWLITIMK